MKTIRVYTYVSCCDIITTTQFQGKVICKGECLSDRYYLKTIKTLKINGNSVAETRSKL